MPLFKTWTFLTNRPCMSNLNKCNTKHNQTRANMDNTKGQCLQVNLSSQKCIQTGLVGGMPQPHVKMFLQERTHSLIQHEEQEKYVNGPLLTSIMRKLTIIQIIQTVRNEVPQFCGRGLGPVLTQFLGAL